METLSLFLFSKQKELRNISNDEPRSQPCHTQCCMSPGTAPLRLRSTCCHPSTAETHSASFSHSYCHNLLPYPAVSLQRGCKVNEQLIATEAERGRGGDCVEQRNECCIAVLQLMASQSFSLSGLYRLKGNGLGQPIHCSKINATYLFPWTIQHMQEAQ